MKIAFYGSSLLSAYWNGAATYYRGILAALATHGCDITFFEPDAFDRQSHRDIEAAPYARVMVYPATEADARRVAAEAARADIVVKASGVGVFDDLLLRETMRHAPAHALRVFWDVDAPATLSSMRRGETPVLAAALPGLDLVLTYGGGPPVMASYRSFGARKCCPIYNALDPATHHPAPPDRAFEADLAFLGNRLPDREERVAQFFLVPAARLPEQRFLLAGSGWADRAVPPNVRTLPHVPTARHNAFNATPRAVLNVARDSMADVGFSPATRVFEAAGAGACLITDVWDGIDLFLQPGDEVLVARDGLDVAGHLAALTPERARAIGAAARARVLRDHTYGKRGAEAHAIFAHALAARRADPRAA